MSVFLEARVAIGRTRPNRLPSHVFALSWLLAGVSALTAALTAFVPDVLLGPAVTNGNARGTALVMLFLAVPLLLIATAMAARGSWRAVYAWLGAIFYLGYNAFLLLFLTPFNRLFLLNVATESLAIFAGFALFFAVDGRWVLDQMKPPPYRGLAVLVWLIVAFNAIAWLQVVIPAIFAPHPGSFLEGTGVATNAIYVQDLVLWLPLMAISAWWTWRGRRSGVLLTGSWLFFGIIESIGIGVDQWFGHQADPSSSFATLASIPLMAVLALVNAIGLWFYLRPATDVTAPAESSSTH